MIQLSTSLCHLLGISYPIIQAPVGSVSCPNLAAAVSEAGGFGMLSMSWRSVREIHQVLQETRALTNKPWGVNFVLDVPVVAERPLEDRLDVCLQEQVCLVSLSWGTPTKTLIDRIHNAGSLVAYTVWSVSQARHALENGVDILVAQGKEAGGHLNSALEAQILLSQIVQATPGVPVVAAGAIGDGKTMAKALRNGASGVWMGTRFVASEEGLAHPIYKDKIVQASIDATVVNTLYDKGWPGAPHRTLKNSTLNRWDNAGCPPPGQRPSENEVLAYDANGHPITRYEDTPPLQGMTGNIEALAMYAGTSASAIDSVQPVSEIMRNLVAEAKAALGV